MPKFQSTKVFDGFSCVFRQWKAEGTHCRFLHGYGISFRVWFEGELDERNWVWDFGDMKRAKGKIDDMSPKEWMDYMFDHTLIVAEDDPYLAGFKAMGAIRDFLFPTVEAKKSAIDIQAALTPVQIQDQIYNILGLFDQTHSIHNETHFPIPSIQPPGQSRLFR